jgi:hypothetical protein
MRNQTVKFGKLRLARFEAVRVYSYELSSQKLTGRSNWRRSGVVRIGV